MFALQITAPVYLRPVFAAPADAFRNFTSDPNRAAQYPTKRAAFAAGMALDAGRLLPRGAVVDVVPVMVAA